MEAQFILHLFTYVVVAVAFYNIGWLRGEITGSKNASNRWKKAVQSTFCSPEDSNKID